MADTALRLILASASPRRLDLLRLAGLDPEVVPANIDEGPLDGEDAVAQVLRLARDKAGAVPAVGAVVLGADTIVTVDGAVLGKPRNAAEAAQMLSTLRGRTHVVSTGVAVAAPDERVANTVVSTEVEFAYISDAAIATYVASGEPMDKAGAYGIQGHAAAFVSRINGSWSNVVGLPLVETLEMLRDAGLAIP